MIEKFSFGRCRVAIVNPAAETAASTQEKIFGATAIPQARDHCYSDAEQIRDGRRRRLGSALVLPPKLFRLCER